MNRSAPPGSPAPTSVDRHRLPVDQDQADELGLRTGTTTPDAGSNRRRRGRSRHRSLAP
jgi:hypothetical protein